MKAVLNAHGNDILDDACMKLCVEPQRLLYLWVREVYGQKGAVEHAAYLYKMYQENGEMLDEFFDFLLDLCADRIAITADDRCHIQKARKR